MSGQKTSSGGGLLVLVGVVALAVMVVAVVGLPSREPPDPFEDDPIRIVRLEVDWDPNTYFDPPRGRTVQIIYAVGDDADDPVLDQEDQPFVYVTTAQAGAHIELAAQPDDYGRLRCRAYVNDRLVDEEETDDIEGCFAEAIA